MEDFVKFARATTHMPESDVEEDENDIEPGIFINISYQF